MKAFVIAASLLVLAAPVAAASNLPPITPFQAISNVGACMTVEGHASVAPDSIRPGMDIAMGDPDQGNPFMIYVPNTGRLPDLNSLDGQTIDITGVIQMDRGKAEILLANPELVMVVGSEPGHLLTCDND
jgi:hypothetical protein